MKKAEYAMLEKVFAAEIDGALSHSGIHLYQASKSNKIILKLRDEGYVREATITLGGRFPVEITGWELTDIGRLSYCMACE